MKKITLYYFLGFLLIDSVMGFMLVYRHSDLLINPGQLIRGLLLVMLLASFVHDIAHDKLVGIRKRIFFFICFGISFLLVRFVDSGFSIQSLITEISKFSKPLFLVMLIYELSKNYDFFRAHFDRIIKINFIVFSVNIIGGYFTDFGLNTYSFIEDSSKGMFYGGNPVAVMAIVFFIYYLYNFQARKAPYLMAALLNLHIISTKTVFIIPLLVLLFLLDRFKNAGLNKKLALIYLVLPVMYVGVLYISPKVSELYASRYSKVVERSYNGYLRNGRIFESSMLAPLEMISYRRVSAAKEQTSEVLSNPVYLLVGYGKTSMNNFWIDRDSQFHDAAMDIIDFFSLYGIVGAYLFYTIILHIVWPSIRTRRLDRDSVVILFLFLYSTFGGHVVFSASSGSFLALFLGLRQGQLDQ